MSNEIALLPTPQQLSELSKKGLAERAKETSKAIVDAGVLDPLEVYIRAKKITDYAAALAGAIKSKAEEEARKQQATGKFDKFGATVTHTSTPAKWNYSKCNDPYLKDLEEEAAKLDEKIKNRQKYLQGISEEGEGYIYPKTSEVVTLRKAVKASAEAISITY